ncbi:MAG: PfkB family carbohydrate kinase [Pseudomonadota bacterium]
MTQMPDIVCIGAVLWDVIGRANAHMRMGSDVPGRITRLPGGVAMNIAMALHAYGARPAVLTAVGRDVQGRELLEACERLGVDSRYAYVSEDLPTDQYMAIEGGNGLIAAIADAQSLEAADDKILSPLISGPLMNWTGIIALDGNLTVQLLRQIAKNDRFEQTDLRVAPASPGKAERLSPFLGHSSTTLYVNLEEAGLLLHSTFDTAAEAAVALVDTGLKRALVTSGPTQAAEATQTGVIALRPPEVIVTRITGAGDTFMAAHIAAEARGATGETSLQAAVDAAATYVSSEGYG